MSDSEDDMPLAQRGGGAVPVGALQNNILPLPRALPDPRSAPTLTAMPLPGVRQAAVVAAAKMRPPEKAAKKAVPVAPKPAKRKAADDDGKAGKAKKQRTIEPRSAAKAKPKKEGAVEDKSLKWNLLEHSGVLFPPEYTPHGVKMLYDGRLVDLTPEQEEVATMFAVMKATDYMQKPKFLSNFWAGFREVLGPKHVVKCLDKADFTPIYDWFMAEREKKKTLPKEEKERMKKEKEAAEAKYKFALVDGRKEQVGNFRVEPPGLFRGRGEHPKMGMIKRRIFPRDITINIGEGAPLPEHPYVGQDWREVRHDKTVTWLAFWKDPISEKDYKYVWLAANSQFKSESDLQKYEKARKLKLHIDKIREDYERAWESGRVQERQMGVALYFIDKLALRAGHEKDDDEADTVGCCNLKVENVECLANNHIKFDFLGKDSIRYENEVAVKPRVWELVKQFCRGDKKGDKAAGDQLFDTMDANDLNKRLKELMDGLSVKVFRTYNASIVLDQLLHKESASETVDEKKGDYDRANKEVAILCNHQRAVPKGHSGQMEKLEARLLELQGELDTLSVDYLAAQRAKNSAKAETLWRKVEKKKEQIAKVELNARAKEDLKMVALGTSKINYLDPRITIAWCKAREVPLEKVFNKSLLSKFFWAMDAPPDFRF
ncbi:hypothetical protein WJX81_002314 [Elliptochloris bilobata]|uniref:DNA topoisomerase I n=1 Tax=Elliptochloris bilobata TaxID=381761 RepID=A0AAW1RVT6_9CHLO